LIAHSAAAGAGFVDSWIVDFERIAETYRVGYGDADACRTYGYIWKVGTVSEAYWPPRGVHFPMSAFGTKRPGNNVSRPSAAGMIHGVRVTPSQLLLIVSFVTFSPLTFITSKHPQLAQSSNQRQIVPFQHPNLKNQADF
jgi:hypothetical protein